VPGVFCVSTRAVEVDAWHVQSSRCPQTYGSGSYRALFGIKQCLSSCLQYKFKLVFNQVFQNKALRKISGSKEGKQQENGENYLMKNVIFYNFIT
jgi:hypothetical protein